MTTYRIGSIPGDGIGPEVVAEGLKVLKACGSIDGFDCDIVHYPYSGAHYLATGELLPDSALDEWRALDAVLLGAIGHPDLEPGFVERAVILGLRFGLDLFINLRPVKLLAENLCPLKGKAPADIDFVVVRENTEGFYGQIGGNLHQDTSNEVAVVTGIFTREGTERVIRYAFELARERARRRSEGARTPRVTVVDKANALRPQSIWARTYDEVASEYPDIDKDHAYVDACCMWMIKNPDWFDVIVTTNMFGDIVTDLGAMLQGGLGLAASGNIHPGRTSMFEPVHGSAPKYTGQNVANPLATMSAVAMMLEFLGQERSAGRIESAIRDSLVTGRIPSVDARSGLSTTEIGDMITAEILAAAE